VSTSGDITLREASALYRESVDWMPILEYRDYYDLPRLILLSADSRFVLLDCPFDELADESAADYAVYVLAADPRDAPDWRSRPKVGRILGHVPVASITFDPTRRQAIRSDGLAAFLS
jgi:hypothetical protein